MMELKEQQLYRHKERNHIVKIIEIRLYAVTISIIKSGSKGIKEGDKFHIGRHRFLEYHKPFKNNVRRKYERIKTNTISYNRYYNCQ